jgi:hypothetical protein
VAAFSTGPQDTAPACAPGRRRLRERGRPAARARKARQQHLGHPPDDPDVDDLRPLRIPRRLRPAQPGTAAAALSRRARLRPLVRLRVRGQPFSLVAGLPAGPPSPRSAP